MSSALLLISHGSRSPASRREVEELARALREKSGGPVEFCFLDVDRPGIGEGVDACVRQGARRIVALPHFLTSGNHVLHDIPRELAEAAARHPGVDIVTAPFVGSHARIADLMLELAAGAK